MLALKGDSYTSCYLVPQGFVTDHLVLRGWFQTLPIAVYGFRLATTPAQQARPPAIFTELAQDLRVHDAMKTRSSVAFIALVQGFI